jgi:hypothetical protein
LGTVLGVVMGERCRIREPRHMKHGSFLRQRSSRVGTEDRAIALCHIETSEPQRELSHLDLSNPCIRNLVPFYRQPPFR